MGRNPESSTGTTLRNLLDDPTSPDAWKAFVDRYGPKILRWCRKWQLQDADAWDVSQDVLTKLALRMRTFTFDRQRGRFRGWLKTVTHHAWRDFVDDRTRAGVATGDSEVHERLQTLAAGDDLVQELDQEHERELLEAAMKQVQLEVKPRDWKIFQELAVEGRPGKEVAQDQKMTVTAVYMVRSRVQKKLEEAIRRLDGPNLDHPEERP